MKGQNPHVFERRNLHKKGEPLCNQSERPAPKALGAAGRAILLLPAVLVVIQREMIGREERYLERTFGEEYLQYKASVRR